MVKGESFAKIYDAHYPRVFRYLLGRLHKAQEAEELAAEVFAIALESLGRGAAPRQMGSWLVGIAEHVVAHFFRRQKSASPHVEECPAEEEDPEELALGRLESGRLWQCLDALRPEHRQVLLLRIVAGLSAREVAEMMDRTEEAVRALQHRALTALRERWMEAEQHDERPHTAFS